jgi:hypothetical protein
VLFALHPAFWVGISQAGTHKKTFATWDELQAYLQTITPDPASAEKQRHQDALRLLQHELTWYQKG